MQIKEIMTCIADCNLVLQTLWMTTAVLQCFLGCILMNKRMLEQLICRWPKALITGDKAKKKSIPKMYKHTVNMCNCKLGNQPTYLVKQI